jgi:hypothetical protein
MKPVKHDIIIYAGSHFSLPVQWLTGDPAVGVDLTGCSIKMQIRKTATSPEVLYELSTSNNKINFVDSSLGKFEIVITGEDSETFVFFRGVYDLEIHYPSGGNSYRIMQGSVTIDPNVTRG